MIWTVCVVLVCAVLLALLCALVRALMIPNKTSEYVPAPDPERALALAEKLSRMVRVDTVSVPDTDQREKFLGFHRVLEELFPRVHAELEKTEIDGNLLFHWKGKAMPGRWCS